MNRLLLLLLTFVLLTTNLAAQPPAGAPAAGGSRPAPPSIGRLYGKLVDSVGKPVAGASVVLLQHRMDTATKKMKEVLLRGATSAANGDFNLEQLPVTGQLKLTVSAIGYSPLTQTVSFNMQGGEFEKDLGKLSLATDAKQMSGVVVTASSNRLRMDIDKKVFSVDQNIVSAGGTAVDVMKNVPSVNVDIDGNVSLRNAAPQIYVDGRPTTLSLDQIPADAIESVEVITNPSAKFDASGGNAGILNIVLKKNKRSGYNGNINAGVDKRGGFNGGGSFSFRQDKLNFTAAAFGNMMRNRSTSETSIRNLLTTPNLLVDQTGRTRMQGGFVFGRLGADYFVSNRTTLSLGLTRVHGSFNPNDMLRTDSAYSGNGYVSYSERNAASERTFNAYGATAGFKYLFPRKGEELTGDANLFSGASDFNAMYNTDIYASNGGAKEGAIRQQLIGSGTNRFLTMQADYVRPFGAAGKLEAGGRAQLRSLTNRQGNFFWDANTSTYKAVPSSSANYANTDNVYAAYLSYGSTLKNFGYKLGLRAESSEYEGELTDTKRTFTNAYPLSLFPSLFLSQKLSNRQEVQMSYTRRVNRPFFMQVIPFIDSTDNLNWTRGNAALRPEFTNALEASYSKTLKGNNTILASVYYKRTTDLITRFLDTVTTGADEKRPVLTYENAASSRSVGAEITSQNNLTKWWDMNANFNVYNALIDAGNVTGASQPARWSYFAKMNNNFKLPKNYKIQLSGTYQSRSNLPVNQGGGGFGPFGNPTQAAAQGYIRSNYGVDIAFQKSFLKNNAASLTFNVSDVFATRRFQQYSESAFFIQDSYRLGDVPMFRLNFSYRFGQMDMSLFKRKNMKAEGEAAQGAMQGL